MRMLSVGYISVDYFSLMISGAPERIRTSDLCLRRAALYPAELRVRRAAFAASGTSNEPLAVTDTSCRGRASSVVLHNAWLVDTDV